MKCKYCGKEFKTERGYEKHNCKKKMRSYLYWSGMREVWKSFCKIYDIKIPKQQSTWCGNKIEKQEKSFIECPCFIDLHRFYDYQKSIQCIDVDSFMQYLKRKNINIKNWTFSTHYKEFLGEYLTGELTSLAIKRSEEYIVNNVQFNDDIKLMELSPLRLYNLLRYGQINIKYIIYKDFDLSCKLSQSEIYDIKHLYNCSTEIGEYFNKIIRTNNEVSDGRVTCDLVIMNVW